MRYRTILLIAGLSAILIASVGVSAFANVLMSESFVTDPYADRWSVDFPGTPGTDCGDIIWTAVNGVNHLNPDEDGHIYSRYTGTTVPGQQITWLSSFTSAGYNTARLSFYLKNDAAGGTVTLQVKDAADSWQTAWNGDLSTKWTTWTQFEVDLPYTVTGVRVFMLAPRTRLDEISITGIDPVPEPSSMLALASGFVGLAGYAIRRRR